MDDETRQAFAEVMKLMNDQHERLIERLSDLARDFQNTTGFLIEDSLTLGRRITNVEHRLDGLEKP